MIKASLRGLFAESAWSRLSGLYWRERARAAGLAAGLGRLGPRTWAAMAADPILASGPGRLWRARIRGYPHPLHYRPGTSDRYSIKQVFVLDEQGYAADVPPGALIVDCGANIGCASVYLLEKHPGAHLIAVEPDPGNFAVCRKNLEPYEGRATAVHAAVWPEAAGLIIERGTFRDGREWSTRVRPAGPEEAPDLPVTTIDQLIDASGSVHVALLKIDIESAEAELFARGAERWLRRVRNLAIEVHGPECERVVRDALRGFDCEFERSGELLVFRDIRPLAGPGRVR